MTATKDQVKAAFNTVAALGAAIRELKQVPAGVLYAHVMGYMDLATYMKTEYKWVATKGEQYQHTVCFGFCTKKDAQEFASRENRRHNSGYYVAKVSEVKGPKFI
jgi:hypothetical protein